MSETLKIPGIIVRDVVLFPGMNVNFTLVQPRAIRSCELALGGDQLIYIAFPRTQEEVPTIGNLYEIGVIARVKQINKLPNKSAQLSIESLYRGRIVAVEAHQFLMVETEKMEEVPDVEDRIVKEAMVRNLRETFFEYITLNPKITRLMPGDMSESLPLTVIMDRVAGSIPIPFDLKISLLETEDVSLRYDRLIKILSDEMEVLKVQNELKAKIKEKVDKGQRDYLLREQMSAIRKELGEDPESDEQEYLSKLASLEASDEIKAKIKKEIDRLSSLNNGGSEAQVERIYVETLLEMPWDLRSEDNNDIKNAEKILNRDHYGLDDVKDRILEFLAVRSLTAKGQSPILCLVGPPGTGKTSIARSVAEALNKKYVRVCLGGVRDEAEIRGHRRTYVGAMPGVIADGLKNAGVKNPLMLLDEIDKVGTDHRGDTASALLEVLDGEQNAKFKDHYISLPMDLSEVFFVATANSTEELPRPLLDRMEIIEVNSYTSTEKFHIAKEHLLKKQYEKNGLTSKNINICDSALRKIIESYTREAGVRGLERSIGEICRKAARRILSEPGTKITVKAANLSDFLGKEKYRTELKNEKDEIGIVRGLAWTQVGGDTLQIEVNTFPGKGELILTGQMGDVMKESAEIGLSFVRSIAPEYKIDAEFFEKNDIHLHIPEGAVPKDGPSAGITMASAMLSAVLKVPVSKDIAMTGEITLRGRVLAVGGLREKVLAAKTAGITKLIVPFDNRKDIEEIPGEIREGMEFNYVKSMKEVIGLALKF